MGPDAPWERAPALPVCARTLGLGRAVRSYLRTALLVQLPCGPGAQVPPRPSPALCWFVCLTPPEGCPPRVDVPQLPPTWNRTRLSLLALEFLGFILDMKSL